MTHEERARAVLYPHLGTIDQTPLLNSERRLAGVFAEVATEARRKAIEEATKIAVNAIPGYYDGITAYIAEMIRVLPEHHFIGKYPLTVGSERSIIPTDARENSHAEAEPVTGSEVHDHRLQRDVPR